MVTRNYTNFSLDPTLKLVQRVISIKQIFGSYHQHKIMYITMINRTLNEG